MVKLYAIILIILVSFLMFGITNAQKPNMKFEKLETNEDFDLVRSILRDSKGYLWIGNDGTGLAKNDGYHTIKYIHDATKKGTISNDGILELFEDSKKNLWVGTRKGLNIYNPEKDAFTSFKHNPNDENSISNNTINSIFEDDKNNLWIGTDDGLNKMKKSNNGFIQYKIKGTDNFVNNITSLAQDSKGNIWLATMSNGIYIFDQTKESFTLYNDSLIDFGNNTFKKLYIDNQDKIWIGTFGSGLIMFDSNTYKFKQFNAKGEGTGTNGKLIYDLIPENGQYLIVGVDQGGINILNKETETFEYIVADENSDSGLTNNGVYCLHKDTEGILWVGTSRGGVNYSNPKKHKFKLFRKNNNNKNSISHNIVTSFYEDSEGIIWIGTDGGGLNKYNKKEGTFQHYMHDPDDPNSISGNVVLTITEDKNNNLWVGTWNFGMNMFNKRTEKFKRFMPDKNDNSSISSRVVWNIYIDNKDHLWLATFLGGGVDIFDINKGVLKKYNQSNAPSGEVNPWKVYLITNDRDNNIWVCAKNGLFKYNKKTESFHLNKNFKDASVYSINQDDDGNLWIGTGKQGVKLIKPDGTLVQSYTSKDGLPNNHICAIQKDKKGNMWISTNKGISQFIRSSKTFRNYSAEDGLQGNKFFDQSFLKTNEGEMYFGGTNGFSSFYPDSLKDNEYIPPVYINDFLIFNKPVPIGGKDSVLQKHISETKKITLTWKQSVLTFGFSAINFTYPQKNSYAYKMEDFEEDWNYTKSDRRYASYTNLPPDDYVFRVRASNNDGVWNKKGTSLAITILPPWWQTWWFRVSAFLFIIISVLSFYFYRVNALKMQKRKLEQKVAERTSELSEANAQLEEKQEEIMQQNEEILSVNEQLKHKNEEVKAQNEEIESQKEEIESSRDQLEKAFNNITLLSDFGQKLTATFDFDAINTMIYDYVSSLMDTSAFGIGIYNEKRNTIDFPYFMERGEPIPYFFKSLTNETSLSVRCFKNSEEIVMNDLSQEYIKYLKSLPEIQTEKLPASVIHIPLIVKNKSIGLITVNSFKKNAFDKTDLTNLRTLASYISIALDNSMAYRVVSRQKEQITGSIIYGQTIQRAMLPSSDFLDKYYKNFILFRPKDIVSGDFYWFSSVKNLEGLDSDKQGNLQDFDKGLKNDNSMHFFAVVDCTGHGVPGAFMSMIGSRLLNEIVNEKHIFDPKDILEHLDNNVKTALRQEETHNNDGMDLGIVKIEQVDNAYNITYASAKQNLFIWKKSDKRLATVEGTRRSIGGFKLKRRVFEFENNTLTLHKGDVLYLSSDGLPDQCDPQRKKFSTKRLKEVLEEMGPLELDKQFEMLSEELDSFQKGYPQRDDITLVGLQL